MGKRTLLTPEQIETSLAALNDESLTPWEIKDNKLLRRYDFKSFGDAMSFMSQIALDCEKLCCSYRLCGLVRLVLVLRSGSCGHRKQRRESESYAEHQSKHFVIPPRS